MNVRRGIAAVCFAVFFMAASAWAGDPTGKWKWTAEGAGGRKMDTTLELKLQGDQLSGSIDNRLGKVDIRDAKLTGEQVSFTVERKIRRRKITVKYNGTLEGDTIKGTIETTGRDKEPVTVPWNAERVK
ncbi:MAG TPA: hypothetical protein VGD81_08830 [Opitutaceae bacterium]